MYCACDSNIVLLSQELQQDLLVVGLQRVVELAWHFTFKRC